MTKQTKLVATLSAAALLALGMSAVSFAAGWDNSTGEWQWLDNDGNAVTDTWKSANGNWFYLGSDGNMVTDSLIEDTKESKTRYYYVDQYGAMVTNTWKAVAMDSDYNTDIDAEYWWYYFGSDGKAYTTDADKDLTKSRLKTINGLKYAFDEEGHMLYGWIDKTTKDQQDDNKQAWETSDYYFNGWNDGHMATGWQKLTVENNDGDDKNYWFYFGNDGEKVKDKVKKIDGKKYHFGVNGEMKDDWVAGTNSDADFSDANLRHSVSYVNGDGSERKNKWVWAIPDEKWDQADYDDDEYRWFYFGKDGRMYTSAIKKINGKKYAFDDHGEMMKNFVTEIGGVATKLTGNGDITRDSLIAGQKKDGTGLRLPSAQGDGLYYFSDDEAKDGSMKKGYQKIELDDGEYQFYFDAKDGKAVNGYVSKIKKFVANGLVMQPTSDDDSNYMGVSLGGDCESGKDGYKNDHDAVSGYLFGTDIQTAIDNGVEYYLVSKNGSIVTNKTKLKDSEDNYYIVNQAGKVLRVFASEDAYNNFFKATVTRTDGTTYTKSLNLKFNGDNLEAHYKLGNNDQSLTWANSTVFTLVQD